MAEYPILTLSDEKLVAAFVEIADACTWAGKCTIQCHFVDSGESVAAVDLVPHFKSKGVEFGAGTKIRILDMKTPASGGQGVPLTLKVVREGFHDKLTFQTSGRNLKEQDLAAGLVDRYFQRCSTYSELDGIVNGENKATLTHLSASSQALDQALNTLIEATAKNKAENLEYESKRRAELKSEYDALREELEEKHRRKDEKLKEREHLLDISDNTTARRKLRTDFKEEVEKARSKSRFFNFFKRSIVIHSMFLVSCIFLGFIAWGYGNDLSDILAKSSGNSLNTSVFVALAVKSSLAAVGALMMTVYYIRWFDGSLKRLDREEVRLERALVDIDRSSWLVEIALEWKKVYPEDPIPSEILERLSRGVFEEGEEIGSANHPTEDAMAALLGAAKRTKIKFPNGEVEVDQKGVTSARKMSAD